MIRRTNNVKLMGEVHEEWKLGFNATSVRIQLSVI